MAYVIMFIMVVNDSRQLYSRKLQTINIYKIEGIAQDH